MLITALSTVLTTILKIWKPIIFIAGFLLIIAFSIAWIAAIISFFITLPFAEYMVEGTRFTAYLGAFNIFIAVSVPLLSLAFLVARLIFNKRLNAWWSAGIWSFWTLNIISLFVIGSTQAQQFNAGNEIKTEHDLSAIKSDTLVIGLQQDPFKDALFSIGDLQLADGFLVDRNVHLNIVKSEGEQFALSQVNRSRGKNTTAAKDLAANIGYDLAIDGNTISLPENFAITKETKWRAQAVILTLHVPVGKTIRFENEAEELVSDIAIDRNVDYPWLDSNQYWVMENNGLVNKDWEKKNSMNRALDFSDFTKLQIEGKLNVVVEKGDVFRVSVAGKENYIDRVEATQLDQTLSIVTDIKKPSPPARLEITMPSLLSIDVHNAGDVYIKGFSEKNMLLKNDGDNELKAFVNVDSLFLSQDGRGVINVSGNGKFLKADLDNYGEIDAERFNVIIANVKARRFSQASVSVSDAIQIAKDNSSKVNIEGEPQIFESDQ